MLPRDRTLARVVAGTLAATALLSGRAYGQDAGVEMAGPIAAPAPVEYASQDANPLSVWPESTRGSGFEARVEISETWIDNIDLAGPGQPKKSDFVTQVTPGFTYSVDRNGLTAGIDYSAQGVLYARSEAQDQVFHRLDAGGEATLVDDLLYLEASAGANQTVIDAAGPRGTLGSVLNAQNNLANAISGSVAPSIRRRIGSTQFDARFQLGFVNFEQVGEDATNVPAGAVQDSDNQQILARWGTHEQSPQRLRWSLQYDRQVAEYDLSRRFEYEQQQAELGFRVSPSLTLLGFGGRETEFVTGRATAAQKDTFWRAGFAYAGGPHHELEATYGKRFFGSAYNAQYRYTGRRLRMFARYEEGPTTQSQEFFLRPAGGIEQGSIGDEDLAGLTSQVFIRKYGDLRASLTGRLTTIDLEFGHYRRLFPDDAARNDRTLQGTLSVTRRLGARSTLRLGYSWRKLELLQGGLGSGTDESVRLEYLRTLTRTITASLAAGRVSQDGSSALYDANFVTLRLGKTF